MKNVQRLLETVENEYYELEAEDMCKAIRRDSNEMTAADYDYLERENYIKIEEITLEINSVGKKSSHYRKMLDEYCRENDIEYYVFINYQENENDNKCDIIYAEITV